MAALPSAHGFDPSQPRRGARQRLTARFGNQVAPWFDELPGLLSALAARWQFELGPPIPRGSMSVVFRCRMADGRGAVLKASPDRARLAFEAVALDGWHTAHTPAVLALAEELGALLLEAIEPGTPLAVASTYPDSGARRRAPARPARQRRARPLPPDGRPARRLLYDSSAKLYDRPGADGAAPAGALRAWAPARNPAFDAVDLLCWRADDLETIQARAERLAAATGLDAERLLGWCAAFAGMIALELANQGSGPRPRREALLRLAALAPTD